MSYRAVGKRREDKRSSIRGKYKRERRRCADETNFIPFMYSSHSLVYLRYIARVLTNIIRSGDLESLLSTRFGWIPDAIAFLRLSFSFPPPGVLQLMSSSRR
jgi:hypothetical protein